MGRKIFQSTTTPSTTQFSHLATKPSKGLCARYNSRTPYKKIIKLIETSKSFYALAQKTQIHMDTSLQRDGDGHPDFNRQKHTLLVAKDAVELAIDLGLNADLTYAIALSHDCGHTPGGHTGEKALKAFLKNHPKFPGKFAHAKQAARNLMLEGIFLPKEMVRALGNHGDDEFVRTFVKADGSTGYEAKLPSSRSRTCPEGLLLQIADNSAATIHNIKDLMLSGLLTKETALANPAYESNLNFFGTSVEELFSNPDEALTKMRKNILDHVKNSAKIVNNKFTISFGDATEPLYKLREEFYKIFETAPLIQHQDNVINLAVSAVCEYYDQHPEKLNNQILNATTKLLIKCTKPLKQFVKKGVFKTTAEIKSEFRKASTRLSDFIAKKPFAEKMAVFFSTLDDIAMNKLVPQISLTPLHESVHLRIMQASHCMKNNSFGTSLPQR